MLTALLLLLPAAPEVRFNRDIRPILAGKCFKCHGPDLKKGGLDLQNITGATKKLASNSQAVVPGDHAKSAVIERVTSDDKRERMPPKGDPLTPDQVAKLKAWIDQGAKYEEHWAYVQPARPALPKVKDARWPRAGMDYYVLARLDAEGLTPNGEAEPAVLLRRAALDLTGLPPTPADLDRFLNDKAPGAYERAVDRLLASAHYGEHQAKFWLDVARYADTNGYEKDERRTMWPYRDWVIRAFNDNKPFDRFTIEQIAGDLLRDATDEQVVATGFHRNTMTNTEGGTDDEEFRIAAVVDRVNTTMEVWMGTTMGCAQCHNHKYDPFTTKEYYSLFAFFNNTADPGRSITPTLELATPQEKLKRIILQGSIDALQRSRTATGGVAGPLAAHALSAGLPKLTAELAAIRPASTLVMRELPKPRDTHVLIRGNHKSKGEKVTPATPTRLHPMKAGQPLNRLGLAKWLVDEDNPLTARVLVNRLWARYFGRGLVETSEELGTQGELPTHPELLDWLATEMVRLKWDLKAFHKLIVTSATYRQSSRVKADVLAKDPFNRLFARGPRFRLDAEVIRDNALAISGLLSRKIGGPSVFPYQPEGVWFNPYSADRWVVSSGGDQHRRGMYTFWRRTAPYAAFMAFDAPSREVCAERRPRTNTPLQALATLNDPVFVEASAALARRMMTEGKADPVAYGFKLCVARAPTARERELVRSLYGDSLAKYQKDAAKAKALTAVIGDAKLDAAEWASWTVVANVLLNLDETITKE